MIDSYEETICCHYNCHLFLYSILEIFHHWICWVLPHLRGTERETYFLERTLFKMRGDGPRPKEDPYLFRTRSVSFRPFPLAPFVCVFMNRPQFPAVEIKLLLSLVINYLGNKLWSNSAILNDKRKEEKTPRETWWNKKSLQHIKIEMWRSEIIPLHSEKKRTIEEVNIFLRLEREQ